MHKEESFPKVGRTFKVRKDVGKEICRVSIASVSLAPQPDIFSLGVFLIDRCIFWALKLSIIKYDDFVYAKDGEGAGDLAGQNSL